MECRIIITNWPGTGKFDLAMFDPVTMRCEPLGSHPVAKMDGIVRDLKVRMEKEHHRVTFSEVTGPR